MLARYPHIKRLVVVADRGLLSLDNLEALSKLPLAGRQQAWEFILAAPGRRYGEFAQLLAPLNERCAGTNEPVMQEVSWQGHCFLGNGTLALDDALKALDIGPGDEVVVTPHTFIASISCVINAGSTPVFSEVEADSGNL